MTMQPTDERSPFLGGELEDLELRESDFSGPGDARVAPDATRPRSRRAPDYRLRGLDVDFEAPAPARAPARTVRKQHPINRRRRRRHTIQWVLALLVTALIAVLLRAAVFETYSVSSASMAPTLTSGTDVVVLKSSLLTRSVKAGDIVVFHEPKGFSCGSGGSGSRELVERVIARPGDTIRSTGNRIYVDGRRLVEPGWYNRHFGEVAKTKITSTKVPSGSYFVMGDNRTNTCDSRMFGPVAGSSLVGRVVATIAHDGHPSVHFL